MLYCPSLEPRNFSSRLPGGTRKSCNVLAASNNCSFRNSTRSIPTGSLQQSQSVGCSQNVCKSESRNCILLTMLPSNRSITVYQKYVKPEPAGLSSRQPLDYQLSNVYSCFQVPTKARQILELIQRALHRKERQRAFQLENTRSTRAATPQSGHSTPDDARPTLQFREVSSL